ASDDAPGSRRTTPGPGARSSARWSKANTAIRGNQAFAGNPRNGAAQDSNLPSLGLPDLTGFEDRLGHRAHAAPRIRLATRRPTEFGEVRRLTDAVRRDYGRSVIRAPRTLWPALLLAVLIPAGTAGAQRTS